VVAMLQHHLPSDWGSAQVAPEVARDLLCSAVASASLCVMQRGCVPPTRSEVLDRLETVAMSFVG